jgi:16S rRNA (cytidine1402-2'-O)-methyltransferase
LPTLFVVATPLGHLGDLSQRAVQVLTSVPVVAAEDTRRVRGLLTHLGAHPRVLSFHAHSPERRAATLVEILSGGQDVALVTDAGTPGISDPGPELVAAAREAGITVVPIPGASAVTAALSVSGFPADRYLFLGFIPRKGKDRHRLLALAAASECPVVFYEAPSRVAGLLQDLAASAGTERPAFIGRELTKLHEEMHAGTLAELGEKLEGRTLKGEFTIVVGPGEARPQEAVSQDPAELARDLLRRGLTRRQAVQELIEVAGVARNEAYRIVMESAK